MHLLWLIVLALSSVFADLDLGRRISLVSGKDREPQFLFQRISVAIQRFNAVLLHDGFFCLPTTRVSAAPVFNFLH